MEIVPYYAETGGIAVEGDGNRLENQRADYERLTQRVSELLVSPLQQAPGESPSRWSRTAIRPYDIQELQERRNRTK
jgi:hypothetical protein